MKKPDQPILMPDGQKIPEPVCNLSDADQGLEVLETTSAKEYTYFQMVFRRFLRHKLALTGFIIIGILISLTLLAGIISKYDPTIAVIQDRFIPPFSPGHLLGTDDVGRDVFTRILYGGRISLMIGFITAITAGIIGALLGSASGYFGGWFDSLMMRIVEIFFSIPTLPILITLSKYFGGSPWNIILIMVVFGWAGSTRMVRGLVLQIKQFEYIEASKAIGCSNARIVLRHVVPNTIAIVLVSMTLSIGGAILTESSLSFLGLGVQPDIPTWGNMLSNAMNFMWNAPHLVIWPGLFIFLTILSFNFLGDGLRDALDPKLKV